MALNLSILATQLEPARPRPRDAPAIGASSRSQSPERVL